MSPFFPLFVQIYIYMYPFAFSYFNCCCDKQLYLRCCDCWRKLSEGYKREVCVFASEFFLFAAKFFSDCAFLKYLLKLYENVSCSLKIGARVCCTLYIIFILIYGYYFVLPYPIFAVFVKFIFPILCFLEFCTYRPLVFSCLVLKVDLIFYRIHQLLVI